MQRLVEWVNDAWLRIQTFQKSWHWMWRRATVTLAQGESVLTVPADFGRLSEIRIEGRPLQYLEWGLFAEAFWSTSASRPTAYTVRPDGVVALNADADSSYELDIEYYAKPTLMVESFDEPGMPSQYHMLIVWSALLHYSEFDVAPELLQKASRNYAQLLGDLSENQVPDYYPAGPVA